MKARGQVLVESLLFWIAVFVGAVVILRGEHQDPQQKPPVFRAGAVFVNVDAYPRRDGKVVDGLTRTDFEIFEDGKPQTVETFEFVRVAPSTPDEDRRDPNTVDEANREAANPRNRLFVIYLDIFHTTVSGSHYARQPIVDFLTRTLGPSDLFAVTTPRVPPTQLTFGRRTETLERELEKYWIWGEEGQARFIGDAFEGRLSLCPGSEGLTALYRDDLMAGNLEDLMTRLQNLRDERKNILLISEGWVPRKPAPPGASTSRTPSIPTIGIGPGGRLGTGQDMSGMPDRAWCDSQAVRLLNIDFEQRFRDLLRRARQANVSFYPVDVGGLKTHTPPINANVDLERYREASLRRIDTLAELAINTDGRAVINTNDLASGVRRISDDLSAYYLLGYYSTNTATDGRYRRIEVKVKTSNVKVSARQGYQAPTAEMRKAEEAARSRPIAGPTAVDVELGRLSRLRPDARAYTAAIAAAGELSVVVELASQEVAGGRWSNGGAVSVIVTPKDGAPVSVEGRIDQGARSVLVKLPVADSAKEARLRVAVKGDADPIDEDVQVVIPAASWISEPLVFRAGASPRAPLRAVADYQFTRTERLHVEWYVTKPMEDRSARLLGRRGDPLPVPVAVTDRTEGSRTSVAADLTLAPLAPGDYVIELNGTSNGEKIQRLLAFRIR